MYSKTEIIGNLGRDPEMRFTPAGQAVTQFSVATSYSYNDNSGQKVSITTWFRVSAWGKMAEACNQYLKKGSRVFVEGRLNPDKTTGGPRIWNKQDGTPAASFEVTASRVLFLTAKGEGSTAEDVPDDDTGGEVPF